jgi:hypothetical protein
MYGCSRVVETKAQRVRCLAGQEAYNEGWILAAHACGEGWIYRYLPEKVNDDAV